VCVCYWEPPQTNIDLRAANLSALLQYGTESVFLHPLLYTFLFVYCYTSVSCWEFAFRAKHKRWLGISD